MPRTRYVSTFFCKYLYISFQNQLHLFDQAKKSDIELANMEREKAIRELAENQIDENLDMVKMLNSLGARAAAFTIRDQQLADRERRASVEGDYDKRMDLIMEIDRLKDLAERERIEVIIIYKLCVTIPTCLHL
jgi:hypothetical protein